MKNVNVCKEFGFNNFDNLNVFDWIDCEGWDEREDKLSVRDVIIEMEVGKLKMNNWWMCSEIIDKNLDMEVVIERMKELVKKKIEDVSDEELVELFDVYEIDRGDEGKIRLLEIGEDSVFILSSEMGIIIDIDNKFDKDCRERIFEDIIEGCYGDDNCNSMFEGCDEIINEYYDGDDNKELSEKEDKEMSERLEFIKMDGILKLRELVWSSVKEFEVEVSREELESCLVK